MNEKPKNIDELIKYLNISKGIATDYKHKRKLMNMGYYHGYKGYRFLRSPKNFIGYRTFEELEAIYNFDLKLKTFFYPQIMFIETSLKNLVLEMIIKISKTNDFTIIYRDLLDNYKSYSPSVSNTDVSFKRQKAFYKKELRRRLLLHNRIYNIQTKALEKNNKIVSHYLLNHRNLPIWAIFELLTLGEFGYFVKCLNLNTRKTISNELGLRHSDDTNYILFQRIIFIIKDFRNAVAHNDVILDTRFKSSNIDKQVVTSLQNNTNINNITFNSITDYLILVLYLSKLLGKPRSDLIDSVYYFINICEQLRNNIPLNIYHQIIYTDNKNKLKALKEFILN